ncbi:tetratricopeptide repeat protein [Pseudaestuariivita rosea]|uniref:tetratricopeptide repeat protein n=1 Tax=Pseudaestuariivita rosea TaxID=2763263 RepID=UPI001ABA4C11|nr:tetratricopeptide repeat protein [Pseudaestuariivita rosea]
MRQHNDIREPAAAHPDAPFPPQDRSRIRTTHQTDPAAALAKIHVLGPLTITTKDGTPLTLRNRKAQGMIALLALAPRAQRTRVWLRSKLWSESDEQKSSTSLRQTVFEIKKDLGAMTDHILQIDRQSIALRLDKVWIDLPALKNDPGLCHTLGVTRETELLEGCDVADEEFEEWLTVERQLWDDLARNLPKYRPAPAQSQVAKISDLPNIAPVYCLGFLPNIEHGCSDFTSHIADQIQETVARNLKEFQPLQVIDFRSYSDDQINLTQACEAEFFIRVRALQVRQKITLTLFLYRTSNMTYEWSQSIQMDVDELFQPDSMLMSGFISQNVERLAKSIFEDDIYPGGSDGHNRAGYTALNLMFKLDHASLMRSIDLLDQAQKGSGYSVFPSLRSYAATFALGENIGRLEDDMAEQTRILVRETLDANPFNSISLACLGHVMGYAFGDHTAAGELMTRALNLNSSQAFVWDHYALHKFYIGEYDAAYQAAKRANYLGAYSPISYTYETTLAMAATMQGRHREAIAYAKNALAKQPRFIAAMRYLIANYGHLGEIDKAKRAYEKLIAIDPDFQSELTQKERFRLTNKDAATFVIEGIRRSEY